MSSLHSFTLQLKKQLFIEIREQLGRFIEEIFQSAESAHQGAIHDDARAKSKYETHGLELSYLAGSQYQRAQQLIDQRQQLIDFNPKKFGADDEIAAGALVQLAKQQGQQQLMILSLWGAGIKITVQNHHYFVVSPQSPLGDILVGSYLGETVEVPGEVTQLAEIINLI